MKKMGASFLCFIMCIMLFLGCKSNETDETKVHIVDETCEIVESAEFFCDKPMESGIYTSKTHWDKAVKNTDVAVVIDRKDFYNEDFFEEKDLVYIADVSSGNSQCEYEGFEIEEVNGKAVLKVKVSYSTDKLLNKLHTYHIFFTMNKSVADGVDDIKLEVFPRD